MKRKPLSKKTRFEVFKRDRFTCLYCGRRPPDVLLEVDHIVAVSNGGTNDLPNLATSCMDCNRGKSDRPVDAAPAALDEMVLLEGVQEAMERAYAHRHAVAAAQEERAAEDAAIDGLKEIWSDEIGTDPGNFRQSIRNFLRNGLSVSQLTALTYSVGNKVQGGYIGHSGAFAYFCGACWRTIREAA